MKGWIK